VFFSYLSKHTSNYACLNHKLNFKALPGSMSVLKAMYFSCRDVCTCNVVQRSDNFEKRRISAFMPCSRFRLYFMYIISVNSKTGHTVAKTDILQPSLIYVTDYRMTYAFLIGTSPLSSIMCVHVITLLKYTFRFSMVIFLHVSNACLVISLKLYHRFFLSIWISTGSRIEFCIAVSPDYIISSVLLQYVHDK
jgi:hypothetical protein